MQCSAVSVGSTSLRQAVERRSVVQHRPGGTRNGAMAKAETWRQRIDEQLAKCGESQSGSLERLERAATERGGRLYCGYPHITYPGEGSTDLVVRCSSSVAAKSSSRNVTTIKQWVTLFASLGLVLAIPRAMG